MRLSPLIGLTLLCILGIVPAQAQQQTHLDKLGLSITIPDGWEKKHDISTAILIKESGYPETGWATYVQFRPGASERFPVFRMLHIEQHSSLNWFQRFLWTQGWRTKEDANQYELIDKIPEGDLRFPFDNGQGFIYRQHTQAKDIFARVFSHYVVHNGRCYRIVIGGAEDRFDEDEALYLSMLRSIRFDN